MNYLWHKELAPQLKIGAGTRTGAILAATLGFICSQSLAAPILAPTKIKGEVAQLSFSPDGTRVAYSRKTPAGWRIFVSRSDGSETKMLTTGPHDDIEPSWRPDGLAIAFASNRAGQYDLFSIRPDGSGLRALTNTRQDERYPQWSPRAFGLFQPGDINEHIVVGRSKKNVAPNDLKLLEMLAKNSTDWDAYSYKFDIKPLARYYKLLFVEGSKDTRRIATMREDGTLRQSLNTGMPGAHYNPCWERSGATIAFLRRTGNQDTIYQADYPNTADQNQGEGKPRYDIDLKAWRSSIRRVGVTTRTGTQLNWTTNGEYIAAASGCELRLWPRPGSGLAPVVTSVSSTVAPSGFGWSRDAKTAVLTVYNGATTRFQSVTVNNPLLDIVNLRDFESSLNSKDRSYLARNSFVGTGAPRRQMFHPYEQTDYADLPIFITTDSLLHTNHLIFDYLLREVEKDQLLPSTLALTTHYLQASLAQAKSADPAIRTAAQRNAAFFAVAASLAQGAVQTGAITGAAAPNADDPLAVDQAALRAKTIRAENERLKRLTSSLSGTMQSLPPEVKRLVSAELTLIRAHGGMASSPIFEGALSGVGQPDAPLVDTRIDYGDFLPRGHYTRSEVLRRYFLMSRWLAGGPFRRTVDGTRRALLIVAATDPQTRLRLNKVLNVVGTFVGEADDGDIPSYAALAQAEFGQLPKVTDLSSDAKIEAFLQRVAKLPEPRIAPSRGPAFRVLPQPYTPDAEIMQALIYDRNAPDVGTEEQPRYFALGLDVMGVLGSVRARTILDNTRFQGSFFNFDLNETQYAGYDDQFKAQKLRFAAWKQADWNRNLYTRTLYALLPLLTPKPDKKYQFTRNEAWTDKNLNAALATWAELKHDTMPKQPVAIEAGGEGGITEAPLWDPPQGFIEPAPEVFQRLTALVNAERASLQSAGYLSPALKQRLDTYAALLKMVAALERKQRSGVKFTPREIEQIRFYGAYQEHLTLVTSEGEGGSMEGNDMAIIADVASAFSTRQNRLLSLQEGVGRALPLYVAVERNGRRELACGAAFTYYEFTQPSENRLTDEKWREMLDSPKAPQPPSWTKSFISRLKDLE